MWETHTDPGTGRSYYYNPDTGVTTWESPFETPEGTTSPATSRASVGSGESLETEWGQYWDEERRRVFYNPLIGETRPGRTKPRSCRKIPRNNWRCNPV